jgi:hypothetical protein
MDFFLGYYSFSPSITVTSEEKGVASYKFNRAIFFEVKGEESTYKIVPLLESQYVSPEVKGRGLPDMTKTTDEITMSRSFFGKTMKPFLLAHECFFLDERDATFREGQAEVYAIRDVEQEAFPLMSNVPLYVNPLDANIHAGQRFLYAMFSAFKFRSHLAELFTKALKGGKGKGDLRFSTRCNYGEFLDFVRLIPDYERRMYTDGCNSRKIPIIPADDKPIRSDSAKTTTVYVEVSKADLLERALGFEFGHFPILIKRGDTPADPASYPHASISFQGSGIVFQFDLNSDMLVVTAPVIIVEDLKR